MMKKLIMQVYVNGTDVNETQGLKSLSYYKSLKFGLRGTYVQAPTFHLFQLYPTTTELLIFAPVPINKPTTPTPFISLFLPTISFHCSF